MTGVDSARTSAATVRRLDPGVAAAASVALVLLAFAATVDFPRAEHGFKGDEATYYVLGHSLARDFDFTYERHDLIRVWEEYHAPEGIFLKRGKVNRFEQSECFPTSAGSAPTIRIRNSSTSARPSSIRFVAAPFVSFFGTNGFLIFHALLLALDIYVAYRWLVDRWIAVGACRRLRRRVFCGICCARLLRLAHAGAFQSINRLYTRHFCGRGTWSHLLSLRGRACTWRRRSPASSRFRSHPTGCSSCRCSRRPRGGVNGSAPLPSA